MHEILGLIKYLLSNYMQCWQRIW